MFTALLDVAMETLLSLLPLLLLAASREEGSSLNNPGSSAEESGACCLWKDFCQPLGT